MLAPAAAALMLTSKFHGYIDVTPVFRSANAAGDALNAVLVPDRMTKRAGFR